MFFCSGRIQKTYRYLSLWIIEYKFCCCCYFNTSWGRVSLRKKMWFFFFTFTCHAKQQWKWKEVYYPNPLIFLTDSGSVLFHSNKCMYKTIMAHYEQIPYQCIRACRKTTGILLNKKKNNPTSKTNNMPNAEKSSVRDNP